MSFKIDQWKHEFKTAIQKCSKYIMKNKTHKYMTPLSKNVCIDKLNDIVDKYNNTYHKTNKMKPFLILKDTHTLISMLELIISDVLNLRLVIMF